jgi:hypothetical protein
MMDLDTVRISPRELEQLCGLEVSDRFIGGLIGGVYRFSKLKGMAEWMSLMFFEGAIAALLTMISLPIGIWFVKMISLSHPALINQVMALMVGSTAGVGLLLWNGWMLYRGRSLRGLMHLLDEVDRFHGIVQAVQVLQQLQPSQTPQSTQEVVDSLQVTRDCLVAGLKTERILREQGQFLSRLENGFTQVDHYLTTLQTLELQDQANEYARLLQQALTIGQTVREELLEMRQTGRSPTSSDGK